MPPIDSADRLCPASVDTLCVSVPSTAAVRYPAESSKSVPGKLTASPKFRLPKVFLAPASSAIGQRLRQMECSRHFPGTFPILTGRLPVSFQCTPQRFPILGSEFHNHFLDLLLDEPLRQPLQLLRVASVPASLKLVLVVDFDVSHHDRQLLLMDINSSYRIRHRLSPGGSGERARDYIKQGLGLSPLPQGKRQRTIYSLHHARSGSDKLTASVAPLLNQPRRSQPPWIMARSEQFS